MSVREQFGIVTRVLETKLSDLGFRRRGQDEWVRVHGKLLQRVTISLREPPGEDTGYVEVFAGFNFPDVETLAAGLQGKKPRTGFMTCSLNIGLLTPNGVNLEWPLGPDTSVDEIARLVADTASQFIPPFLEEFSSVADLLSRFEANDFRVCRGSEWPWRQIAAACLDGQTTRATELLKAKLAAAPSSTKAVIESALSKVNQYGRG